MGSSELQVFRFSQNLQHLVFSTLCLRNLNLQNFKSSESSKPRLQSLQHLVFRLVSLTMYQSHHLQKLESSELQVFGVFRTASSESLALGLLTGFFRHHIRVTIFRNLSLRNFKSLESLELRLQNP